MSLVLPLNTSFIFDTKSGDKLFQGFIVFGIFTFGLSITEIPLFILSSIFISGFIVPPKGCIFVIDFQQRTEKEYISVSLLKLSAFNTKNNAKENRTPVKTWNIGEPEFHNKLYGNQFKSNGNGPVVPIVPA